MNRGKHRSCTTKATHKTKEVAFRRAREVAYERGGVKHHVYKCGHCPYWHISKRRPHKG